MQCYFLILAAILVVVNSEVVKDPRILPIVNLVRFQNDACTASGGALIGTCYSEQECKDLNGVASGSCANGYGVCCVFQRSCGMSTNQNCTYFTSDNLETANGNGPTTCKLDVCPCGDNICQIRLDFIDFEIAGPSTDETPVSNNLNGAPVSPPDEGNPVHAAGQCVQDEFSVTSRGFRAPSPICGINTGQHMYVDMSTGACECNALKFFLGSETATRSWNIKITQYACNSPVLPPRGCTQYFYGQETAVIESYNYNDGNGRHLADQNQNVCIRREGNFCRICYQALEVGDVQLSNAGDNMASRCGNYNPDGKGLAGGFDFINIPNPETHFSRFCGSDNGLSGSGSKDVGKVCTFYQPFNLQIVTDHYEVVNDAGVTEPGTQAGVQLTYTQDSVGC